MNIFYGIEENKLNITSNYLSKLKEDTIINLESDSNKHTIKKIYIVDKDGHIFEYDFPKKIYIVSSRLSSIIETEEQKLNRYHNRLQLEFGTFMDELPEQKMVIKHLTGNEKILEIGGNIGRNSLIIASILKEKENNDYVVLESHPYIVEQLKYNRNLNEFNFHIENAALSKRNLIQKGWDTIVSDEILDGYIPVPTITFDELNKKYNIIFDTLVLDCEGAFYYILQDMPEILNNIKLIIMENDYHNIDHKHYVDEILRSKGFYLIYNEEGGWEPCKSCFFQTWKKL